MKKTRLIIIAVVVIIVSIWIGKGFAENKKEITLNKGKNYIEANFTCYADELIKLNPEIEYISYSDNFSNQTFSFINVFGGIGKNFKIKEGEIYEISVKRDTKLKI